MTQEVAIKHLGCRLEAGVCSEVSSDLAKHICRPSLHALTAFVILNIGSSCLQRGSDASQGHSL